MFSDNSVAAVGSIDGSHWGASGGAYRIKGIRLLMLIQAVAQSYLEI